jgi:hypothetical protein
VTDEQASTTKPTSWGGPREGAGRPPGSTEDLVDLDTQVRRDQRDWLDRVKEVAGDKSRAVTLRRVLDEARRVQGLRHGIEVVAGDEHENAEVREYARSVLAEIDGKTDDPEG